MKLESHVIKKVFETETTPLPVSQRSEILQKQVQFEDILLVTLFAFFKGIDSKAKRPARTRGVIFDNLVYNKHTTFLSYCNIFSNFRAQERVVQTKQ